MNKFSPILGGILLLMGCHAIAILLFLLFMRNAYTPADYLAFIQMTGIFIMGFMLWQCFYVLPLVILLEGKGFNRVAKGVMIGAMLTALLNGIWYLMMSR